MQSNFKLYLAALFTLACAALSPGAWAAVQPPQVQVSALRHMIGQTVTVEGRTGYIVSHYEKQGMHVFTLRDDYDNQILVHTIGDTYPVMGVTYQVTGQPTDQAGTLFLDTAPGLFSPVYPVTATIPPPAPMSLKTQMLLWLPTLLSMLALMIVLGYVLARWFSRIPPAWGELTVTSGPDRGLSVPLHYKQIPIGRGVSPQRGIRLAASDPSISNRHALLLHRHGEILLCDISTNGSRIGGERLIAGKPVVIKSGDLIHLGTQGTVIIVRQHAAETTSGKGFLGILRETAPLADKTIMGPDAPPKEAAWRQLSAHSHSEKEDTLPAQTVPQEDQAETDNDYHEPGMPLSNGADKNNSPVTSPPPVIFKFAGHEPKRTRQKDYDVKGSYQMDEHETPPEGAA